MTNLQRFELIRNAFGQLVLTTAEGVEHVGVVPVRAFALTAPDKALALVSVAGEELAWIDNLADLPAAQQALLVAELNAREFMPEIKSIRTVSSYATPSTWDIETSRGNTYLVLDGEEDIRRLNLYGEGIQSLIISDSHGVQFFIPNRGALDRHSKKLLDRFL